MTTTARVRAPVADFGVSEPVVSLRDVFCVHRTGEGDAAALQGTTLAVAAGELVCVLGPSGAGKTTLLRVIAGLEVPSAGVVQLMGWDIGRLAPRVRAWLRHQAIGFLPQHAEAALPPDLSAREAVAMPLALRGAGRREQRARAAELLESTGLAGSTQSLPHELSGGERQRLALCLALAHRPALLLADEPTGELDAASAEAVRKLIAELCRAAGTTAIIVSHDPATSRFADRSVRLRDGRVAEDRRAGERGLVVGRGGWLHLPTELLSAAGIADRAEVRLVDEGLVVRAPEGAPVAETAGQLQRPRGADARGWQPALVELRNVRRSRGSGRARRDVLRELDARLAPGRMTVVTGPSGCGKTTLLRLLAGLDRADAGEVLLNGISLGDRDAEQLASHRRERIGYLPQEPSPVAFLSAAENVVLSLRLRGWEEEDAAERAAVVLSWLELSERSRQRVMRLSAGEAQRVALARALASARGLLIVDEPTSRLDEARAGEVAELLARTAIEDAQTVICATHDPQLVTHAHELIDLGG